MTYQEILERARPRVGPFCKACPVCNGIACKNTVPGPGAKAPAGFIRNYQTAGDVSEYGPHLENASVDTRLQLIRPQDRIPVLRPLGRYAAAIRRVNTTKPTYKHLVSALEESGIAAFTGDGSNLRCWEAAVKAIGKNGGCRRTHPSSLESELVMRTGNGKMAAALATPRTSTPPGLARSSERSARRLQTAKTWRSCVICAARGTALHTQGHP